MFQKQKRLKAHNWRKEQQEKGCGFKQQYTEPNSQRANFSPFTKDYRGLGLFNVHYPIFQTPVRWGVYHNQKKMNHLFKLRSCFAKKVSELRYRFEAATAICQDYRNILIGPQCQLFASDNLLIMADDREYPTGHSKNSTFFFKKMVSIVKHVLKQKSEKYKQDLQLLINEAVKVNDVEGACTITICLLNEKTGTLHTIYIGDSVYGVFKKKHVQMMREQIESFGKPFMVSKDEEKSLCYHGESEKLLYIDIRDNLIVVGNRGLWNNLTLDRIHYELIGRGYQSKKNPTLQSMATDLANLGKLLSEYKDYTSPYYLKAIQEGIAVNKTGRMDDIAVILAKIIEEEVNV